MGKSAPQAPKPPDPYQVASAQTGSNIGSAVANATIGNANVIGPQGSTTFNQTGSQTITGPNGERYTVPQYTQTNTLSPTEQAIYDQQAKLRTSFNDVAQTQLGRVTETLGKPPDTASLPSVTNDFSADRSRVEQALFDRLNPQLERDRNALETKLVNQGFQRGTEAFTGAMDQYGRQVNDARLAVTGQGLQEQQGLFGMSQANRDRAFKEMLALRNQPINEISALTSGGQVSMPNWAGYNAPQVAPTDVAGNVYNTAALQNSQYQQAMQQYNQQMAGMYGLGSAAILGGTKFFPSDRRLKRDIIDLGIRLVSGLKLYAYRYLWDDRERVGVMADEAPVHVVCVVNGFKLVNYRAL